MRKVWHKFRLMCCNTMYRDCIDHKMNVKLWKKIMYHERKLKDLEQSVD